MTATDELQTRLESIRALNSMDQENMLKAARMTYAEDLETQAACVEEDDRLVDQLRVLRENMTNNRARLGDVNASISYNTEIIATLEAEKIARMTRKGAAE